MSNKKNDYENMSIEELMSELSKVHKRTKFKVKKANINEHGHIILDPENKNDQEWYENDKDYDVLRSQVEKN
ncbi:hypothetical protein OEV82_13900 [Caldibacillus thermolactis]|jgi:hypothetical protein|uniref:Uncharacterized protein n=1 Tax=Pallidibacillus thermolactis TaxID=251051 RepID=A0ABT2WIM4_9BACI|nr:hypothetical protein [Pallidibacillus thermolactis]MCU9595533.1 hypothetical protein [Pallidibacillus thermolactis]MCU9601807.1 hypothetical protein [Pallidibacillus thermolactis subsp. kokeshiiformis]MED1674524.1 hypothetical protein [Pallidibacillus thermolactis subsp. kokeshiiformis]